MQVKNPFLPLFPIGSMKRQILESSECTDCAGQKQVPDDRARFCNTKDENCFSFQIRGGCSVKRKGAQTALLPENPWQDTPCDRFGLDSFFSSKGHDEKKRLKVVAKWLRLGRWGRLNQYWEALEGLGGKPRNPLATVRGHWAIGWPCSS